MYVLGHRNTKGRRLSARGGALTENGGCKAAHRPLEEERMLKEERQLEKEQRYAAAGGRGGGTRWKYAAAGAESRDRQRLQPTSAAAG